MPPCGVPATASKDEKAKHCIEPPDVNKIVWSGFSKKWPAAYEFLKQLKVDAAEQQPMMLRIDKKGEDIDAVVKHWIDTHEPVWQPWIKAAQS